MQSLDDVVKELDTAVNNKDKQTILQFYEEDSLLVIEPGRVIRGKSQIADFLDYVFAMEIKVKQIETNILQVDDLALFTSKWSSAGCMSDGSHFSNENTATSVFRKSSSGEWRLVIDNSFGPEILNQSA